MNIISIQIGNLMEKINFVLHLLRRLGYIKRVHGAETVIIIISL